MVDQSCPTFIISLEYWFSIKQVLGDSSFEKTEEGGRKVLLLAVGPGFRTLACVCENTEIGT